MSIDSYLTRERIDPVELGEDYMEREAEIREDKRQADAVKAIKSTPLMRVCEACAAYAADRAVPVDPIEARIWQAIDTLGSVQAVLQIVERQNGELKARSEQAERALEQAKGWQRAALRVGEELASVGPDGYYAMTPEQWRTWALESARRLREESSQ